MRAVGWFVTIIFLIAVLSCLSFGLEWAGIKWTGFFGPKRAAVEREVFKEGRSYNDGKKQELVKLRLEYMRAKTSEDKAAIASAIRHQFSDYDENRLESPELRNFLHKMKYPSAPPKRAPRPLVPVNPKERT